MKYLFTIIMTASLLQSCDFLKKDSNHEPLIPKNTPFIVSILEATADTVHHYPEVYVGYLSDPEGFEAKSIWSTDGIWWPITNVQVTRPATRYDLKRVPDTEAQVIIKGPLDKPDVKTVQFAHEGSGVYGDVGYQLRLKGGETYRLSVTLSDGRQYTANTLIPKVFEWNLPDTVYSELELNRFTTGVNYEQSRKPVPLPVNVGSEVAYVTYKLNSEHDYLNYDLPPGGGFFFNDRGDFLRGGAAFGIFDAFDQPQTRAIELKWVETANKPLRMSEYWWLTQNHLNESLSNFYYSVFRLFASWNNGRYDQQDMDRIDVIREHDSSYLFDYMSNIKKMAENGEVLPKEQSDAFGVFGAYSAAYRNITVIPKRSWDPDPLNWGNQ